MTFRIGCSVLVKTGQVPFATPQAAIGSIFWIVRRNIILKDSLLRFMSAIGQIFDFIKLFFDKSLYLSSMVITSAWYGNCNSMAIVESRYVNKKGQLLMEAISDIGTANDIRSSFMKLMVAQLQNQNPLEPLDNNEMASQLAQLSELQQLETLNSNFGQVLVSVERSYANSLIGKEISFLAETETGGIATENGTVEQIYYAADGEVLLKVGDYALTLKSVLSVEA